MGEGGSRHVGAVANAVRLLRTLAQADAPLRLTAAARAARVSPSTALHILRTLAAEGLVAFDPASKTYAPGLGLLPLARGLLGHLDVDRIRPELVRLATTHRCLLALWQIDGERVVLVDRAIAATPVRLDMEVTRRMPAFIGAIGRAYAARSGLPADALRTRFEGLRWEGEIDFERYLRDVEEARARGFAIDRETLYRGINTAAAVVPRPDGPPRLGISAIGLAGVLDEARLSAVGAELSALCAALGEERGGWPPLAAVGG